MSRLPPIIGITGKAGVGKDTLAMYLASKQGYTRRAFADPIKELLNKLYGWKMEDWDDREWKERKSIPVTRRDGTVIYLSPRQLAQWLGTEVGRNTFGEDCWIRVMERYYYHHLDVEITSPGLVIPDVRFDNEAKWIQSLGGRIIRVSRPSAAPVEAHISEAGIDDIYVNFFLVNGGSIMSMYHAVDHYLENMHG